MIAKYKIIDLEEALDAYIRMSERTERLTEEQKFMIVFLKENDLIETFTICRCDCGRRLRLKK